MEANRLALKWVDEMRARFGDNHSEWLYEYPTPAADIERLRKALQPAALVLYDEPPLCLRRRCLCTELRAMGLSQSEMVAKHARCLREIEQYEQQHNFTYDFVTKFRADGPQVGAKTARLALSRRETHAIWTNGWSSDDCLGSADWFAIMPRRFAPDYFNLATAECAWANASEASMARGPKKSCKSVERYIVHWPATRGVPVCALQEWGHTQEAKLTQTHTCVLAGKEGAARGAVKRHKLTTDKNV